MVQCHTLGTEGVRRQRGVDVFHIYELFLIVSGMAMLVMAGIGSRRSSGLRIWNGILGLAFTGYGLYLLLFFKGGHYFLFFYVFVLPVLMVVRFFRDRSRVNAPQMGYGQPGYGQPGYGQPPGPGYGQPRAMASRTSASSPETSPRGPVRVGRVSAPTLYGRNRTKLGH